jgi:ATP-binding cassette subfamily B (MDR/TAP) protein 1
MKDGRMQEEGQHEVLVQANGVYAELVQAQQFEKRGGASTAPSIMSNTHSSHKEQPQSQEDTNSVRSVDTTPATATRKLSAGTLISRCVALSRQESPAIIVGLLCSIISGGIIIGEVCVKFPVCKILYGFHHTER